MTYGHWTDALLFSHEGGRGCLNKSQQQGIMRCSQLPHAVPTDFEAKAAFKGLELLRKEGFKF